MPPDERPAAPSDGVGSAPKVDHVERADLGETERPTGIGAPARSVVLLVVGVVIPLGSLLLCLVLQSERRAIRGQRRAPDFGVEPSYFESSRAKVERSWFEMVL
jgi:hypothetical protein